MSECTCGHDETSHEDKSCDFCACSELNVRGEPVALERKPYRLIVNDEDGDIHRISCVDKGEVLNWCAKFVDEMSDFTTAVSFQVHHYDI